MEYVIWYGSHPVIMFSLLMRFFKAVEYPMFVAYGFETNDLIYTC